MVLQFLKYVHKRHLSNLNVASTAPISGVNLSSLMNLKSKRKAKKPREIFVFQGGSKMKLSFFTKIRTAKYIYIYINIIQYYTNNTNSDDDI